MEVLVEVLMEVLMEATAEVSTEATVEVEKEALGSFLATELDGSCLTGCFGGLQQ